MFMLFDRIDTHYPVNTHQSRSVYYIPTTSMYLDKALK